MFTKKRAIGSLVLSIVLVAVGWGSYLAGYSDGRVDEWELAQECKDAAVQEAYASFEAERRQWQADTAALRDNAQRERESAGDEKLTLLRRLAAAKDAVEEAVAALNSATSELAIPRLPSASELAIPRLPSAQQP